MAVVNLAEFFDPGLEYANVPSKAHPAGHTYRVASPDAKTGLWLAQLAFLGVQANVGANLSEADLDSVKLDDDQETDLYKRVLGDVYDQMIADGVPWDWFQKIGQDAYLRFALSAEVADAALAGQGKAPNRSQRRAAAKAGPKSVPVSGATATRTRRRASTASSSRTGSAAKKAGAKSA